MDREHVKVGGTDAGRSGKAEKSRRWVALVPRRGETRQSQATVRAPAVPTVLPLAAMWHRAD